MRTMRLMTILGLLALVGLTSCGGGSDSGSATTTTPSKSSTPAKTTTPSKSPDTSAPDRSPTTEAGTAGSGSGGWPGANGCDKPSSADIGTAFGTPIVKAQPAADQGCLWETATVGHGVQVSYHPAGSDDAMPPAQLGFLHGSGTVTDLTVPGASQAFLRTFPIPNAPFENPTAYIVYPEGVVQIAMTGPLGSIPQSNQEALVKLFTGG